MRALLSAHAVSVFFALCLLVAVPAAGAADVPQDVKDLIEDKIDEILIHPEAAKWEFDTMHDYVGGGSIVCGVVTAQNSRRTYIASTRFFAIIRDAQVADLTVEDHTDDQPSHAAEAKLKLLCDTLK